MFNSSKGEYDSALKYYYQAVQLWPEFRLAQFRLGQMYIYKRTIIFFLFTV